MRSTIAAMMVLFLGAACGGASESTVGSTVAPEAESPSVPDDDPDEAIDGVVRLEGEEFPVAFLFCDPPSGEGEGFLAHFQIHHGGREDVVDQVVRVEQSLSADGTTTTQSVGVSGVGSMGFVERSNGASGWESEFEDGVSDALFTVDGEAVRGSGALFDVVSDEIVAEFELDVHLDSGDPECRAG